MSPEVLIVDDDPVQRRLLEAQLDRLGYRCLGCEGGAAAIETLVREPHRFSALVLDLMMPEIDGLAVMGEMRRRCIDLPIVVQTGKGGIEAAVEAMRAGAFDFIVKPASADRVAAALGDALQVWRSKARREGRRVAASSSSPPSGVVQTVSPAMAPVMEQALKAASSTIPVLIEGETGVGKEWLAETIRGSGPRRQAPLIAVNCGALPPQLVESILFGHEKGAFTDAGERRAGKFVEADGGTLLLDEIGELPIEMQVKLLRVLQNGEVDPVGARQAIRTDVRILAATNRDLAEEVSQRRFREDLYYRLSVLTIKIPPLRDRRQEIAGLAAAFLQRFAASEPGVAVAGIGPEALQLLEGHDWPGNIRQLENAIHRAVVLGNGTLLQPSDFPQIVSLQADGTKRTAPRPAPAAPPAVARPASGPQETETASAFQPGSGRPVEPTVLVALDGAGEVRTAADVEADLIRIAMRRYDGRMSEIARRLGIGRSTLYRKLREYNIPQSV